MEVWFSVIKPTYLLDKNFFNSYYAIYKYRHEVVPTRGMTMDVKHSKHVYQRVL
jgi:hypothetical protein